MKNVLFQIGGLMLLVATLPVHAQTTGSTSCVGGSNPAIDEILGDGSEFLKPLPPISDHYTRKVLERAQEGIEFANSYEGTFAPERYSSWLTQAFTVMADQVDTETNLTKRSQNIREVTACLNIDLFLIETMMGRVQCKIQQAYDNKKTVKIHVLREVVNFLNQKYKELESGSHDNAHEDKIWWRQQSFDAPDSAEWLDDVEYEGTWCCNTNGAFCELASETGCSSDSLSYLTEDGCADNSFCTEHFDDPAEEYVVCPFHSDYLPPIFVASGSTTFSYGCDINVLEQYGEIDLNLNSIDDEIQEEMERMSQLVDERDSIVRNSNSLKENYIDLEKWLGRPVPPEIDHFGNTTQSGSIHTQRLGCNTSDGDESEPPPENEWPPKWPPGLIQSESRGSFGLDVDESKLMRLMIQLREKWGSIRPYPDAYKLPGEFPDEETRETNRQSFQSLGTLTYFANQYARNYFGEWHLEQERLEGASIPKASDAQRQILHEVAPMRSAVRTLSLRASSRESGVRHFARGLAYWLRRSCINRPCNERLERILKIVIQDDCFPYTRGLYHYVSDPNIQCADAAGL